MEKDWTRNIEWPAVKELINTGNSQKICLLGIDSVKIDEIDGLHENQAIVEPIDNMLPDEIADFILLKYSLITNS